MTPREILRLAEALAAVAIAASSGVALPVAAVPPLLSLLSSALDRHAETHRLQAAVVEGITGWATAEKLHEHLEPGFAIATEAISRHGLMEHDLRRLSYDVDRITSSIVKGVRFGDPAWGDGEGTELDAEHAVARRAIHATVATLITEEHRIEGEIVPLIAREFAEQAERYERQVERDGDILKLLRELAAAMSATADMEDLETYLEQRLEAWDTESGIMPREGHIRHPSQIERDLRMTGAESRSTAITVREALRDSSHLVILGEPGAGKSWLARRIARDAAYAALDALRSGASLDEIEIPLLTTWETLRRQPPVGGLRSRVISASFAAPGNGDLGSVELEKRIVGLVGESRRVLAVVDSLDEAENLSDVDGLLRDLEGIMGWRTVLTSRPSAWGAKPMMRKRTRGVATLQPITWEDGIRPFITSWFSGAPERARTLISHLERDARLRDSAGVPLLLSFYCIYAEEAPVDAPLPQTSHELYDAVIESLVGDDWSAVERPEDDGAERAKQILSGWAWDAVREADDLSGLGNWSEEFSSPGTRPVSPELVRALDNVAPRRLDRSGRSSRAFRHRTLLEHLVAVHISGFSAERAATVLLPHLWFDPDWEVAVPRALALHPEHDDVVSRLLDAAHVESAAPLSREADEQLVLRWLDVMAESQPTEWSKAHREYFHALRISHAVREPSRVVRSAHWRKSNAGAVESLLSAITRADVGALAELTGAIARLAPTDPEHRDAVQKILERIHDDLSADEIFKVVEALMSLRPAEQDRRDAAQRILAAVAGDRLPTEEGMLAAALVRLNPPLEDRRPAMQQILRSRSGVVRTSSRLLVEKLCMRDSLSDRSPGTVRDLSIALLRVTAREADRLVEALEALGLTADERHETARTLLELASQVSDPALVYQLVDAVLRLAPAEKERRGCVEVLMTALSQAELPIAERLVGAVVRTGFAARNSRDAVETILDLLPRAGVKKLAGLVGALMVFDTTETDRRTAAAKLLERLSNTAPQSIGRLIDALLRVEPTYEERRVAATRLLASASGARAKSVAKLLSALLRIGPTEWERSKALRMVLSAIASTADPEMFDYLVVSLVGLEPKAEDLRDAATRLIDVLDRADPGSAGNLIATLGRLGPTDRERCVAAEKVRGAIPGATLKVATRLTAGLLELGPTDEERGEIAKQLLAHLDSPTRSWDLKSPARLLRQLATTQQWLSMIHGGEASGAGLEASTHRRAAVSPARRSSSPARG